MAVRMLCPTCSRNLRAPENLAGKRVKCPSCYEIVAVPQGHRPLEYAARSGMHVAALHAAAAAGAPVGAAAANGSERGQATATPSAARRRAACLAPWLVSGLLAGMFAGALAFGFVFRIDAQKSRSRLTMAESRVQYLTDRVAALNLAVAALKRSGHRAAANEQERRAQLVAARTKAGSLETAGDDLRRRLAAAQREARDAALELEKLKTEQVASRQRAVRASAYVLTAEQERALPTRDEQLNAVKGVYLAVDPFESAAPIMEAPVSKLIDSLEAATPNPQMAFWCATAVGLRALDADAAKAVPGLTRLLQLETFAAGAPGGAHFARSQVHLAAALALRAIGAPAAPAIPALESIVVDETQDLIVRGAAKTALDSIEGSLEHDAPST